MLLSALLATCCAAVGAALLIVWETAWGVAILDESQRQPVFSTMVAHGLMAVVSGLVFQFARRHRIVSDRVPKVLIAAIICWSFVSADMLIGIAFPPFEGRPPTFLLHPVRGWTHRPNHTSNAAGATVLTDEMGMRIDEDRPAWRPEGNSSVLFVGDSLTVGWGVRYCESFPTLTIGMLNQKFPGAGLAAFNGGSIGYDTRQETHWLVDVGLKLRPRVVVLQMCLNDLFLPFDPEQAWDYRVVGDYLRPGPPLSWSGIGRAIWTWRRLPRKDNGLIEEGVRVERFGVSECLKAQETPRVLKAWSDMYRVLDRFDETCRRAGATMVLVCFPVQLQLTDPGASIHPQAHLADWARRHDVPFLDVLPFFRRPSGGASGQIMFDLTHPTALGHRVAAQALADLLDRAGVLTKLRSSPTTKPGT